MYGSTRCTPDPWHEVPMGMGRNDLWIIHSLLVHWGGGDFLRPWTSLRPVTCVPFVNRSFESKIHGTVNFTQFCCVLLVAWCYRVLLWCYLRPK